MFQNTRKNILFSRLKLKLYNIIIKKKKITNYKDKKYLRVPYFYKNVVVLKPCKKIFLILNVRQ